MRTFIFIALLILAPVLASFYGFIHDQMTFSISEEFFTKFRFNNYDFPHSWHPRVRAGMIGMLNAWQTGIPFGIVLTAVGKIHRNTRKLLFYTFYTFVLTFAMASLFSILAAYLPVSTDITIARQSLPANIDDPIAFQRVVQINNFGYVGGIIGMLLGVGLHVLLFRRDKNKALGRSSQV